MLSVSVSAPGDRKPSISDPSLPLLKLSVESIDIPRRWKEVVAVEKVSALKNSRRKANSADALSNKTRSAERNTASVCAVYTWEGTQMGQMLAEAQTLHLQRSCHLLDTPISRRGHRFFHLKDGFHQILPRSPIQHSQSTTIQLAWTSH